MTRLGLIWAEARGGVIGADGAMPWSVPEDLAHFKATTMGAPVVMGRRTWESFPERFRPLPGRRNVVITRSDTWSDGGAERAESLEQARELVRESETVWVIGGGMLYREAIDHADFVVVTELDLDADGDTFAPSREGFRVVDVDPATGWHTSRTGVRYRIVTSEPSASDHPVLENTAETDSP